MLNSVESSVDLPFRRHFVCSVPILQRQRKKDENHNQDVYSGEEQRILVYNGAIQRRDDRTIGK